MGSSSLVYTVGQITIELDHSGVLEYPTHRPDKRLEMGFFFFLSRLMIFYSGNKFLLLGSFFFCCSPNSNYFPYLQISTPYPTTQFLISNQLRWLLSSNHYHTFSPIFFKKLVSKVFFSPFKFFFQSKFFFVIRPFFKNLTSPHHHPSLKFPLITHTVSIHIPNCIHLMINYRLLTPQI